MELPSSFTDLESSENHQAVTKAHDIYQEARQNLEMGFVFNAKTIAEESIDQYMLLKEYNFLEVPYQFLASLSINSYSEIVDYEASHRAILRSPTSSNEEKLQAHLALAGLYKTLRINKVILPPVTEQDLYPQESFHYSEAYKFTQGDLDPEAHTVLQREIGVANAKKLGTYNIQQCVAVIAHDPMTNKVVLSHFDRFSGPLKFIDQILEEFPSANADSKIDLYLTGARDRSHENKKVSDSNINQVLKQIYAYKERFNIKATDLGDKLSPQAIVFDGQAQEGLRLVHRMPNAADISLNSRAAAMNLKCTKGDYLYPLDKIDCSQDAVSRKKSFSAAELQQIQNQYSSFLHDYDDFSNSPNTWKHNQLFQPLLAVMIEPVDTSARSRAEHSEQELLFKDLVVNDDVAMPLQFDFDMSLLQQRATQPSTDLVDVLYSQHHANLQIGVDKAELDGNKFDNIQPGEKLIDIDVEYEQPPTKRICLSNRRKRSAEANACLYSWDDVDQFNLEKEKSRDSEKITIDSTAFLEHLKGANEKTRMQLLQLAATSKISGTRQNGVHTLLHKDRLKLGLHKIGRISSALMDNIFNENALADWLKGDRFPAIQLGGLKGLNHLLEKVSAKMEVKGIEWLAAGKTLRANVLRAGIPFVRRAGGLGFVAYDLYGQINALKKDANNTDALEGVVSDGIQLGTDLVTGGVEVAEISSETFALMGGITGPGEAVVCIVMLGDKIYAAVTTVAYENHLVHLTTWEKFKEGWRAFLSLGAEAYIQKEIDEVTEYNNQLLPKKLAFLKSNPSIKHIIFQRLKKRVSVVEWSKYSLRLDARSQEGCPSLQEKKLVLRIKRSVIRFLLKLKIMRLLLAINSLALD